MAKKSKAQARKRVAAKDLAPKNSKDVKGGKTTRKGAPETYFTMTMEGAFIT
jgi:hypothetical protein